jgi:hypothetical protein
MGSARRRHRNDVKTLFERLQKRDSDYLVGLPRPLIAKLIRAAKKQLNLLTPPWQEERDWNLIIHVRASACLARHSFTLG